MATGNMQVQVPRGAAAGQVIQAVSPEGVTVQATIPQGVPPGSSFIVQYPLPGGNDSVFHQLRKHQKELLIVGGLIIVAMIISGRDPFDETVRIVDRVLHYSALLVVAGLAVIFDWNTHGPTIALQHSAVSAAVAWVVIVPFGFASQALLYIAIIALGLTVSLTCCVYQFWPCGIVLALVTIMLAAVATEALQGPVGETLIFIGVFFVLRQYMSQRDIMSLAHWPNVSEVNRRSEEFRTQSDFFLASCVPWADKYDFQLSVKALYRVDRPGDPPIRDAVEGSRRLFHGTQWESAKGIVCDGFRLPNKAGMFGKGLYFADCPTKSWRYCFPNKRMSDVMPRLTGHGGLIFMCWVDLGVMREEKDAAPELAGYRRTWREWLTGYKGAYDSVVGVEHEKGGSLRVPEYVVYDTKQVRLAYLFEVEKVAVSPIAAGNPAENRM